MSVSSIPQSLLGSIGLANPTSSSPTSPVQAPTAPTLAVPGGDSSQTLRDIIGQYNVRNISPDDFSQMINELQSSGAISTTDFRTLQQVRSSLDSSGASSSQPLDLVGFLQDQLAAAQQKAGGLQPGTPAAQTAQTATDSVEAQLAWVQKFSALQTVSGSQPLDATA
jgi:hypothetical protein